MPTTCTHCLAEITWRPVKKDNANGGLYWTPLNAGTLTDHRTTCEWRKQAKAEADRKAIEKSNARRFGKPRGSPAKPNEATIPAYPKADHFQYATEGKCKWCSESIRWLDKIAYSVNGSRHQCTKRPQGAIKNSLEALVREARSTPITSQFTL